MKTPQKLVLTGLMALVSGLAPVNAYTIPYVQTQEMALVQQSEADQLADALLPIHYYLHQNNIIRLVPPTQIQNGLTRRLQGLRPTSKN
jgi:hypothetical protein